MGVCERSVGSTSAYAICCSGVTLGIELYAGICVSCVCVYPGVTCVSLDVVYVAMAIHICYKCIFQMFQLFYLDVAYVVMDICVYCECMLQMFHLFHTLVASVLSGCCICCSCYIHMLQSYVSIGFTLFQYFAASSAPHVP
jgi:hypothetical protein